MLPAAWVRLSANQKNSHGIAAVKQVCQLLLKICKDLMCKERSNVVDVTKGQAHYATSGFTWT